VAPARKELPRCSSRQTLLLQGTQTHRHRAQQEEKPRARGRRAVSAPVASSGRSLSPRQHRGSRLAAALPESGLTALAPPPRLRAAELGAGGLRLQEKPAGAGAAPRMGTRVERAGSRERGHRGGCERVRAAVLMSRKHTRMRWSNSSSAEERVMPRLLTVAAEEKRGTHSCLLHAGAFPQQGC